MNLILIGGGELRSHETLMIDEFIATLTKDSLLFKLYKEEIEKDEILKKQYPEIKPYALFIPLASYDSKPYFNTFRKIYTSILKLKTDVAIIAKGDMSKEHIVTKIDKSHMIYFGGGNTNYLISKLKEYDLADNFINAVYSNKIIAGLSAGANMWFEKYYSDSDIMEGKSNDYTVCEGLGVIKGMLCPHYNSRENSYDSYILENYDENITYYAIEDIAAIYLTKNNVYSFGNGNAYIIRKENGNLIKNLIDKY